MAQKLLDEKELQDAIRYEIISPSFAERVRELIKAYEQNAAQQAVAADVCQSCREPSKPITDMAGNLSCPHCGKRR